MFIEDFSNGSNKMRLKRILKTLRELHQVDVNLEAAESREDLVKIYEEYRDLKKTIIRDSEFNNCHRHPDYSKAVLIMEAVKIFLSEFSPGRKQGQVRSRKEVKEAFGPRYTDGMDDTEAANRIVFDRNGIPVHAQADRQEAKIAARVWDDPTNKRSAGTTIIKGPIQTFFTPDWRNPVEEIERDSPVAMAHSDTYGLPTAEEITDVGYPENKEHTEASPSANVQATSYVSAYHEDEEVGNTPNPHKSETGLAFAHPAIDQSYMQEYLESLEEQGANKMTKNEKLVRLNAVREDLEARLTYLKKQHGKSQGIAALLEADLEQAELILAARTIVDRIQSWTEDIAKIQVEELMPLTDRIKGEFGPEKAAAFEAGVEPSLKSALEVMKTAREAVSTAVLKLEGKISGDEMPATSDMGMDTGLGDELGGDIDAAPLGGDELGGDELGGDEGGDLFGGADGAAGPEEEPLGRARK